MKETLSVNMNASGVLFPVSQHMVFHDIPVFNDGKMMSARIYKR